MHFKDLLKGTPKKKNEILNHSSTNSIIESKKNKYASSMESKNFIKLLMDSNPKKRPDFNAIKSHKFFEKMDWTKLN